MTTTHVLPDVEVDESRHVWVELRSDLPWYRDKPQRCTRNGCAVKWWPGRSEPWRPCEGTPR